MYIHMYTYICIYVYRYIYTCACAYLPAKRDHFRKSRGAARAVLGRAVRRQVEEGEVLRISGGGGIGELLD